MVCHFVLVSDDRMTDRRVVVLHQPGPGLRLMFDVEDADSAPELAAEFDMDITELEAETRTGQPVRLIAYDKTKKALEAQLSS